MWFWLLAWTSTQVFVEVQKTILTLNYEAYTHTHYFQLSHRNIVTSSTLETVWTAPIQVVVELTWLASLKQNLISIIYQSNME